MKKNNQKNRNIRLAIAGIVFALLVIGLFFLTTVSAPTALAKLQDGFYYLRRQLLNGLLVGLILGFIAFKIPLDRFKRITPYLFGANLILMILLFLPPFSRVLGGGRRWLDLGIVSFQPAELLKVTFILYFAYLASQFTKRNEYRKLFMAFVAIMLLVGTLMVMQPDLSTLAVIVVIGIGMYFTAGIPLGNIFLLAALIAGAFFLLTKFSTYRLTRLLTFLNPGEAPMTGGYQIRQMLYAIGSGGLFGLGLGFSRQKFGFLPHSISDSIFAIIGEEGGFIGTSLIIVLFIVLAWLGFRLALAQEDRFRQLLIIGVTIWITAQAFVHIAANIGLMPLTGIPLPFISFGGSALATQLIGLGFLLNDSKK